ncbi:hypothetical protein QFZ94_000278 [Paraburkholderia sp. JPY465]
MWQLLGQKSITGTAGHRAGQPFRRHAGLRLLGRRRRVLGGFVDRRQRGRGAEPGSRRAPARREALRG